MSPALGRPVPFCQHVHQNVIIGVGGWVQTKAEAARALQQTSLVSAPRGGVTEEWLILSKDVLSTSLGGGCLNFSRPLLPWVSGVLGEEILTDH